MEVSEKLNQGRIPARRMLLRDADMDCYAIMHFGLNTFTDKEWGYGDEDPQWFDPSGFDAEQIVSACRDAGFCGLILVCKHHDGFCLWPTATTEHNITKSPFRNGKGDLVREISDACRKYGLKMGFYVSPWDRNNAAYGTPEYLSIYREQLREIYSNYGPAFEAWFDFANGGDGYYGGARTVRQIDKRTYYDWFNTWNIVRTLQPDAAIFSDIGPDLRWVGNERGFADPESFGSCTPDMDNLSYLGTGHADGRCYMPPECDVPLRPGWFYHPYEDHAQRSRHLLLKIYLNSVGNGGFLNIGIAPDRRGLLHENDVRRLKEFHDDVQSLFSNKQAEKKLDLRQNMAEWELGRTVSFNLLRMREDLSQGEMVTEYAVEIRDQGQWSELLHGKAIGRKRIKTFTVQKADAVRITVKAAHGTVQSIDIALYAVSEKLLNEMEEETDIRNEKGYVKLENGHIEANKAVWKLKEPVLISSFIFTPDKEIPPGTPDRYAIFVDDVKVSDGEFSNLRANPIPQLIRCTPLKGRKITFSAERYLNEGPSLVMDEFGIR